MSGKKGQVWSKNMTKHQRDAIALTKIEKYIDAQIDGQLLCNQCKGEVKEISPAAVQLLKARYDKLRPTLSSVDQTIKEDVPNEQEIMAGLAHLLSANAGVLRQLLDTDPNLRASLQAVLQGGPVAVSAPQQSDVKAA